MRRSNHPEKRLWAHSVTANVCIQTVLCSSVEGNNLIVKCNDDDDDQFNCKMYLMILIMMMMMMAMSTMMILLAMMMIIQGLLLVLFVLAHVHLLSAKQSDLLCPF